MHSTILLILSLFGSCFNHQDVKLSLEIRNLHKSEGKIRLAFYKNQETFLVPFQFYKGYVFETKQRENNGIKLEIKELPKGIYAVALFQDLNGNEKLDKNIFGIPTEPYGFSKNYIPRLSAPKFHDCSFEIDQNENSIMIKLL